MTRSEFTRYTLPALLWAIAIFVGSSVPSQEMPHLGLFQYDKLLHFVVFFILCHLVRRALIHSVHPSIARGGAFVISLAITALYGAFDEAHQSFIPGRSPEVMDWLADVGGAAAYICIAIVVSRWSGQKGH